MRLCIATLAVLLASSSGIAQNKAAPPPKAATVPATIDHDRVIIHAELTLPDGSTERVHAWVDNGNPDLELSRRVATLLKLDISCSETECTAPPPPQIKIGELTIPLTEIKTAYIPLKPVTAAAVLEPGMNAEINLPATVLRHYDVLVNYPARTFSIGPPGTIHFQGTTAKVMVNATGLIQLPSQIERKKYNLALDLGSCISFLSDDVFNQLAAAHADWPHMTGAVGPANMWGLPDEPNWKLMRLDRLQFGPLFLTNVAVVDFPKDRQAFFEKRAGVPTAGILGAQTLLNYRVGIDYAHSTVYFDVGRTFNFPDFDVVGLTLRPEDDGQFTILGVAEGSARPSLPSGPDGVQEGDYLIAVDDIAVRGASMGQVWSMLGGNPGQERKLTIERAGRQSTVIGVVQHFLGEAPDPSENKSKK